jgi:SAM-dependent methyltransferase
MRPGDAGEVYRPVSIRARLLEARREQGTLQVASHCLGWAVAYARGRVGSYSGARTFTLDGVDYPYLRDPYRWSWLTERAVEVPVVARVLDAHVGDRVLEVGNVLSHYLPGDHVVVDKYEQAPGVLNRDVLALDDLGTFDLVIAISTLEHVGWDEVPRQPSLAVDAAAALRARVAPGGQLVLTVPMGYNPTFEAAVRSGEVPASTQVALRRSAGSTWTQVPVADVWDAPYDWILMAASGVIVQTWQRPT